MQKNTIRNTLDSAIEHLPRREFLIKAGSVTLLAAGTATQLIRGSGREGKIEALHNAAELTEHPENTTLLEQAAVNAEKRLFTMENSLASTAARGATFLGFIGLANEVIREVFDRGLAKFFLRERSNSAVDQAKRKTLGMMVAGGTAAAGGALLGIVNEAAGRFKEGEAQAIKEIVIPAERNAGTSPKLIKRDVIEADDLEQRAQGNRTIGRIFAPVMSVTGVLLVKARSRIVALEEALQDAASSKGRKR